MDWKYHIWLSEGFIIKDPPGKIFQNIEIQ